ncbi:protein of unknown function [Taphrina deformans PYCC 5710]|uniref:alpha-1,2-Mannosidase n=1 Tax=Taphrina deformans (strain PYCC 5710 / ATCC 11124 / CBS 356.35 / IMI 108563 / JCM 9778 / NBRC 8474) TaxID=1097556 RepID=R4XDF1_TAPDE|nr:protein of unknown function [Taphrina deformans PYCC 5710]|eukprot:CCG83860.1 protein of unknown function [Taphrina deformans PYCC 5710]
MAIRVSRRAKYLVVLAFISVLLYGSIETKQFDGLKLPQPSSILPLHAFDGTSGLLPKTALQDTSKATSANPDSGSDLEDTSIDSDVPGSEAGSAESLPGPPGVPASADAELSGQALSPANADPKTNTVTPAQDTLTKVPANGQDALADQLAALQQDGIESPDKNLLPVSDTKKPSSHEKFQLSRKENFPVPKNQLRHLPSDISAKIPTIQTVDPSLTETKSEKQVRLARQLEIRDVFKRDWSAYKQFAWMHDELKPVSNKSNDPFGGWGATLVDALDTMLIMDLDDEYIEASAAVSKIDFTYTSSKTIPLFETTIRYLGGLLGAYDLGVAKGKKDSVMLEQARVLGQVLYGAFDTPNRLPSLKYNYRKQAESGTTMRAESEGVMSEAGSLSVEFTRLAQLSDGEDRHKYFDAIQRITDAFEESIDYMEIPGLWPTKLDFSGCEPVKAAKPSPSAMPAQRSNAVSKLTKAAADDLGKVQQATDELLDILKTKGSVDKIAKGKVNKRQFLKDDDTASDDQSPSPVSPEPVCKKQGIRIPSKTASQTYSQGGQADSTYEYFTKEYLLLGGVDAAQQYKRLYEKSIDATTKNLLFRPLVPEDLGANQIMMSGDVIVSPGKGTKFHPKSQHLTCFIGGMYAMGSKVFSRPQDLELAAKLTDGCVWTYDYTPTGVGPECFSVRECPDKACKWQDFVDKEAAEAAARNETPDWAAQVAIDRKASTDETAGIAKPESNVFRRQSPAIPNKAAALATTNFEQSQTTEAKAHTASQSQNDAAMFMVDSRYILRPEAIESVWYMYRITGDKSWQEKGWRMWQATESLTRTAIAHSAVTNLMDPQNVFYSDSLESFWFAETLKYYYLLFSDFETISLDEWVLNTEAHPFKIVRTNHAV